jgi:GT2 family glycosyltransferase
MRIIAATRGSKSLDVFLSSLRAYAPEHEPCVYSNDKGNFGDAYNEAMDLHFGNEEAVVIANDDVVITPTTMPLLLEDVAALRPSAGDKLGLVTARSDFARPWQNVRYPRDAQDRLSCGRWTFEDLVRETHWLSPIFTWVSRAAFESARLPPLNWHSDDVWCADLRKAGFRFFISRSYVHHVGSMTVGRDEAALVAAALPWLRKHRPEYLREWGTPSGA